MTQADNHRQLVLNIVSMDVLIKYLSVPKHACIVASVLFNICNDYGIVLLNNLCVVQIVKVCSRVTAPAAAELRRKGVFLAILFSPAMTQSIVEPSDPICLLLDAIMANSKLLARANSSSPQS